ncbi:PTS glucose transporter subunit IIA [Ruminococcus sp. Marseille-P6503]|uniref:PTS sugar transporter subunit IIA n=1 Tax=Ruminococcus sp. Marseille-P6503 TaxID=2364796 RepID=UPI000F53B2DC|nr:PTS glucose transporter subunit IIA [Ruminococcus sp. Marseille-P6503]
MTFFKRSSEKKRDFNYLTSCTAGEIIPVEKINDMVFSSKILGDGFGVIPNSGGVCSPVRGVVKDITNDGHEINIKSCDGLLVLIHIGMNTAKRDMLCINPEVSVGDEIEMGQRICETDPDGTADEGYDPTIAVIITNSEILKSYSLKTGVIDSPDIPVMKYTL